MKKQNISIIVPIYNAEKELPRCLDSLSETLDGDEIILVNDGSQDESLKICDSYAKKNNKIKIITQENLGVSAARNKGIDEVSNDWIIFVDADDHMKKGWRLKINQSVMTNNSASVIIFSKNIEDKTYNNIECIRASLDSARENELQGAFLQAPWSKVYSAEILRKNKIRFNRSLIIGEDLLFNCLLFFHSEKIIGSRSSIYVYEKNLTSTLNRFDLRGFNNEIVFHRELKKFLEENQLNGLVWNDILEKSLLNGLYSLILKIVKVKDKEIVERLKEMLERPEYKVALSNIREFHSQFPMIKWHILCSLEKENIKRAFMYAKVFNFFKNGYYRKKLKEDMKNEI